MMNPLQTFFSSETAASFGYLGNSAFKERERLSLSTSRALEACGASNLSDVVTRRNHSPPVALGRVDEYRRPDITRQFITQIIKDFFLSESCYLEKHRGSESTARKPSQYFDVRELGSPSGEGRMRLYCCRYGEGTIRVEDRTVPDSTWNDELCSTHPRGVTLAIPSSAGLQVPDAASLVNPLLMLPREYIAEGDAGAILVINADTFAYSMELYWSEMAFYNSLARIQDFGRLLIEEDAVSDAAHNGTSVCDIHRGSALLSKIYECAAQAALIVTPRFFVRGVWGVAIIPQGPDTFMCQLGTIGFQMEEPSTEGTHSLLVTRESNPIVANISICRDPFGFVSMEVDKLSIIPAKNITWYDKLPNLN